MATYVGDKNVFYNDLPPEVQDDFTAKLRHHSVSYDALIGYLALKILTCSRSLVTPIKGAAYREIPSWYVLGTKDQTIPPKLQQHIFDSHKDYFERLERVGGGHSAFASKTADVANIIDRAARS